jgi:hypothetical protein
MDALVNTGRLHQKVIENKSKCDPATAARPLYIRVIHSPTVRAGGWLLGNYKTMSPPDSIRSTD